MYRYFMVLKKCLRYKLCILSCVHEFIVKKKFLKHNQLSIYIENGSFRKKKRSLTTEGTPQVTLNVFLFFLI